jgi:cysteine-rich repeat protein
MKLYIIILLLLIGCSEPLDQPYCGDGIVNEQEVCDGTNFLPGTKSCKEFWDEIYDAYTTFVEMPECKDCYIYYMSCEGDDHDKYVE